MKSDPPPPSSSSFYSDPSPDRKTELVISRIDYEEEEEETTAFPPRHRWRKWLELEQFSGAFSGRASVLIKADPVSQKFPKPEIEPF